MSSPLNTPTPPSPSLRRYILTTLRTKLLKHKKTMPPTYPPPHILQTRRLIPLDPIIEEDEEEEDEWEDSSDAYSTGNLKSASSSSHAATSAVNRKGRNDAGYYTVMSYSARKKWLEEAGRKYTGAPSTIAPESSLQSASASQPPPPPPPPLAPLAPQSPPSLPLSPSLTLKPSKPRRDSMFKIPPEDVELYIIGQRISTRLRVKRKSVIHPMRRRSVAVRMEWEGKKGKKGKRKGKWWKKLKKR